MQNGWKDYLRGKDMKGAGFYEDNQKSSMGHSRWHDRLHRLTTCCHEIEELNLYELNAGGWWEFGGKYKIGILAIAHKVAVREGRWHTPCRHRKGLVIMSNKGNQERNL